MWKRSENMTENGKRIYITEWNLHHGKQVHHRRKLNHHHTTRSVNIQKGAKFAWTKPQNSYNNT